jgi:hypothetical protein
VLYSWQWTFTPIGVFLMNLYYQTRLRRTIRGQLFSKHANPTWI